MVCLSYFHWEAYLCLLFINHVLQLWQPNLERQGSRSLRTSAQTFGYDSLPTKLSIQPALLMRGSNGAPLRLRWKILALSFRSIGSPTLLMRQISPSYGWE